MFVALCLSTIAPHLQAAEAPWVGEQLNGVPCSGKATGYGPFDYTNRVHVREKLPVVEKNHFTSKVVALREGENARLLPDIDYTLRAFPNHHRALFAIIRFYTEQQDEKEDDTRKQDWHTPPECYVQRAIRFSPRDAKLYSLYGLYLHRLKRYDEAEKMYRKALDIAPHSPETRYNLGLLLADKGNYEKAQEQARQAYAAGYPLPALRERLAAHGYAP